jgi:hypothetical protein
MNRIVRKFDDTLVKRKKVRIMISNLPRYLLFIAFALVTFFTNAQVRPSTAAERLKGLQQRQVLEQKSTINHVAFRNIGPTIMSGRVSDLDVNPDDPTEFYVGYSTGGLWHTTNNGQSFTPIFDSADVIGIGDIAVNWKTGTIWVGTGEVNSSRSSFAQVYQMNLDLLFAKEEGCCFVFFFFFL